MTEESATIVRTPDLPRERIVEPRQFSELLVSRRDLERVYDFGSEVLALRDTRTGRLFLVEEARLRAEMA